MSFFAGEKRKRTQFVPVGKSKCQQEFREEADINLIVKKYGPREMLNLVGSREPMFGDFTIVGDYAEALELVSDARKQFMELPAELRDRFENDPHVFIQWFNQADQAALKDAGLVVTPAVPATEELAQAQLDDRAAEADRIAARAELDRRGGRARRAGAPGGGASADPGPEVT